MLKNLFMKVLYFFVIIIFLVAGLTAWYEFKSGSIGINPAVKTTNASVPSYEEDLGITVDVKGIVITDQKAGQTVSLEALFDKPGYIAIYEDSKGDLTKVLGKTELLQPGRYDTLQITLERETRVGERVHAMMHVEKDGNKILDITKDAIAQRQGGGPVLETFYIVN